MYWHKVALMEEKQVKIVAGSYEIFKTFGIRSVSMDDIAQQLHVSKKTLYVYYANKTELLRDVLNYSVEAEDVSAVMNSTAGNAIDILLEVVRVATESMKYVNTAMLFDLNKYYPELSEEYFEKKTRLLYDCIIRNIEQGMREGLYRHDINAELIALLYTDRIKDIRGIHDTDQMKKFSFSAIVLQLVEGHIRGMASEKGLAYYEDKRPMNQTINL